MRERNKHKSCEHSEHGGRDQSQVKNKSLKSSKKLSPFCEDVPKSHNDDSYTGDNEDSHIQLCLNSLGNRGAVQRY